MLDRETNQPIRVNADGDAGPYLLVPLEQLDEVKHVLAHHDVPFTVAADAVQLNGHPIIAVVDFGLEADANQIQYILDQAA